MKSRLDSLEPRICPFCNEVHDVEHRVRTGTTTIKGEPVQYDEHFFVCTRTKNPDNTFMPAGVLNDNQSRARDAFRKKHGLMTSIEISEARGAFGMSQMDFARLFGWGDVTIARYESKLIQDSTYDLMMRMVGSDPMLALELLDRHRASFSEAKYIKHRTVILKKVAEHGVAYLVKRAIEAQYANWSSPCDENGGTKLDLAKVADLISYLSQNDENLFKVKLMKLLWYIDAVAYKMRGRAVTGLVYRHMTYGALPVANEELLRLPGISIVEAERDGNIGHRIRTAVHSELDMFDDEDRSIIREVAASFKDTRTHELVDYMHEEDAYKNTSKAEVIPFPLCRTLRDLPKK